MSIALPKLLQIIQHPAPQHPFQIGNHVAHPRQFLDRDPSALDVLVGHQDKLASRVRRPAREERLHVWVRRRLVESERALDLDRESGLLADLTRVYQEEIAALYAAGCRYLQVDDTNLPATQGGAAVLIDDLDGSSTVVLPFFYHLRRPTYRATIFLPLGAHWQTERGHYNRCCDD